MFYEVVVNKKYLTTELREILESSKETKDLPPWDPMGSLA